MEAYRVISADSHLNEPQEVYDRLPPEYRTRAPRIEERDGERYIIVEGQGPARIEAPKPAQRRRHETLLARRRRGWPCHASGRRHRHTSSGSPIRKPTASVLRSSTLTALSTPFSSKDAGFQLALSRVYNDYYHEVFGPLPRPFCCFRRSPDPGHPQRH